jgi:hypothetical protein
LGTSEGQSSESRAAFCQRPESIGAERRQSGGGRWKWFKTSELSPSQGLGLSASLRQAVQPG